MSKQKPTEGLSLLVGKHSNDLLNEYGPPARKDFSSYGYEWWIYNDSDEEYMQVAVKDNRVVSLYAVGDQLNLSPFTIGQPIDELFRTFNFETSVDIQWNGNSYRFELAEEDLGMRPLIKVGGIYAQVYIDKFSGTISSVRFLNVETLIAQRPYELIYRGDLPEEITLTDEEWKRVEEGNEKQIFSITNIFRKRFDLPIVEWDEPTADVALGHSTEMFEEDYFSHDSPAKGDLGDRLKEGNVKYQYAGENIAAKYVDGIAAFEGWLNSKGHREALLNEEFSHLGVGVYRKYYTQNFIKKL